MEFLLLIVAVCSFVFLVSGYPAWRRSSGGRRAKRHNHQLIWNKFHKTSKILSYHRRDHSQRSQARLFSSMSKLLG